MSTRRHIHLYFLPLVLALTSLGNSAFNLPGDGRSLANITWVGCYSSLETSKYVADSTFINNGVARLANSPYGYYWTSMGLKIPQARVIDGDAAKMEIRAKNPVSGGAIEELDVSLLMIGKKNTAAVTFIGREHRRQFTSISAGKTKLSDINELIQLFQDWSTIAIETKNNVLSVYKNGKLVKSIRYPESIGALKEIQISFKGVGTVDWVHLYKGSKIFMKEEFNTPKKTTATWLE